MTRIFFLTLFLLFSSSSSLLAQTHKEELEKRIKEYYTVQAQDYPNTEAHIKAVEPYIIPTSEGKAYARYMVSTWENFKRKNSNYTMKTEIAKITQGTTDKTAIITTIDHYTIEGNHSYVITTTSEWVYLKKEWYRSAKKSIKEQSDY